MKPGPAKGSKRGPNPLPRRHTPDFRHCRHCDARFDAALDHAGNPGYRRRIYCGLICMDHARLERRAAIRHAERNARLAAARHVPGEMPLPLPVGAGPHWQRWPDDPAPPPMADQQMHAAGHP